jgi:hypothetical protein
VAPCGKLGGHQNKLGDSGGKIPGIHNPHVSDLRRGKAGVLIAGGKLRADREVNDVEALRHGDGKKPPYNPARLRRRFLAALYILHNA